jgi:hypothetical protein
MFTTFDVISQHEILKSGFSKSQCHEITGVISHPKGDEDSASKSNSRCKAPDHVTPVSSKKARLGIGLFFTLSCVCVNDILDLKSLLERNFGLFLATNTSHFLPALRFASLSLATRELEHHNLVHGGFSQIKCCHDDRPTIL